MKTKISIGLVAIMLLAMVGAMAMPVLAGSSSQKVELGTGTERVYPVLRVPYPGECGSDTDDVILQYNTYWGPRVNPDNVRWSSDLWWVRSYISRVYSSGLDANGLSTTTTRVCMGRLGQALGSDIELIYLWHR